MKINARQGRYKKRKETLHVIMFGTPLIQYDSYATLLNSPSYLNINHCIKTISLT